MPFRYWAAGFLGLSPGAVPETSSLGQRRGEDMGGELEGREKLLAKAGGVEPWRWQQVYGVSPDSLYAQRTGNRYAPAARWVGGY